MRSTPTAHESKTMRQVPKVRDVMRRDFAIVRPETSLRDVAKLLLRRKVPGAAVIDRTKRFQGFLSTQGLMRALVDFLNEEIPVGPIQSYLDPVTPVLSEESSLMAAVHAFVKGDRANLALPVLRGERLVGIVTRLDVVRAMMDYFAGGKDTSPGTLYISALKKMDEKPPFES
ncbi:MAG TPA: CBS domain-containing protein [Vicinamibacteria bacterium]|nr:CBS domain-containing protein [Vicinamibacteria bacterium]